MRIENIPALVKAADDMSERLARVDTGDLWNLMTCAEVDSIAAVLVLTGHDKTAAFLLCEHAVSDTEALDSHADIYAARTDGMGTRSDESRQAAANYLKWLREAY
ncbi:hypothetical protein AB0J80_35985 [Actinoplanes sp. NPDC049548]|uniref:hypothetical protein n=1 Tax=Actinoplanes sp. NPDC049548 TaxID=3155152 RepID=UPI00341E7F82